MAELGSGATGRTLFDVAREKMRTPYPAAVEQFLSYLAVERKAGYWSSTGPDD